MKYQSHSSGWIEVICGPMYAGKTEELIRRTTRMTFSKKKFLIFKPELDNRYSLNEVVSHSSAHMPAITVKTSRDIRNHITNDVQAVIIDEAQFFDEELIDLVEELADKGLRVICAGLDCDFKGEPFGIMPSLMARAEKVTKLTAICSICGAEATRTQRIINGVPAKYTDPILLIGAVESYEARCRKCHVVMKIGK